MLRKQNHGFSFTQALVVILVIALVVLIGFGIKHGSEVAAEKQSYKDADAQISSFVNDAAKLAPSTKEIKRYCDRTSAKFNEGQLGCTIDATVEYAGLDDGAQKQVMSNLDTRQQKLSWKFAYDNTKNNKRYISDNYIKSLIYENNRLSCGVFYKFKEDKNKEQIVKNGKPVLQVRVNCDGPALQEYYK